MSTSYMYHVKRYTVNSENLIFWTNLRLCI